MQNKNLKINTKSKKKFLPLITAVFIFLGVLFILKPFINKTIKLNKDLKKEKEILAQLKEKKQQLENIDEEQLKANVEILEEILPSQKPVITLLNTLFNLSNKKNIDLGDLSFSPGEIKEEANQQQNTKSSEKHSEHLVVKFNITGQIDRLVSFIDDLEMQAPLSRVEGFGLNVKDEQEAATTLNLKVFYLPLPESIGKITQPLPLISKEDEEILAELEEFKSPPKMETVVVDAESGKENPFKVF